MSGGAPGGKPVEPNLTPILDMVFQLITFFMLVINFKAAELDTALVLPVIGSAKPMPDNPGIKLVLLNVETCTKCPQCDANAILVRNYEEGTSTIKNCELRCERGHVTPESKDYVIPNGKTALFTHGFLLTKQKGDSEHPSIVDYLQQEADESMMAAKPPLTSDDIKAGKSLDDYVIIRADKNCPFGAVNYIITECQRLGYRNFALKTGQPSIK